MNQVEPQVYIESTILIDREVSRICKEQNLDRSRGVEEVSTAKIFNGSMRYQASIGQTENSEK